MTTFQTLSLLSILAITLAGGYYPLVQYRYATEPHSFPGGKAFTAGVFLALSLTVMLPGAFSQWQKLLAPHNYPVATYLSISSFILLLAIEHFLEHIQQDHDTRSAIIPIVMTLMIGMCALLLGTALGVSDTLPAIMVFLAIMAHKGSASFALALTMVKSRMTRLQAWLCFICFALATPAGIVLGASMHHVFSSDAALAFKATVTSIASGVFLYLATTYELRHTPFVANCRHSRGFFIMLSGLLITVAVSLLLTYASHRAN